MAKVLSVRKIERTKKVYDLSIADNHNLFVCDKTTDTPVLVHNCLDENIKFLDDMNTRAGSLRSIFTSYGNDWYFTAPFSKEERSNIGMTKLSDLNLRNYASMDVQSLHGIHEMQLARASRLTLGKKNYLPYFRRLVSAQMSNTVHVISHMESKGAHVDKLYLAYLKGVESPLLTLLREAKDELYATKAVKEANKRLIGGAEKGGFFNKTQWVFDIGKADHKATLFWDVMQLEVITRTPKGNPQLNKFFQKAYSAKHKEVALFERVSKISHLWSTYVRGWWDKIKESPDGKIDSRLRPRYGWFKVVTGRTNSFDPSLQNVPTRDVLAKHIKRMFMARKGHIQVKFDYSAHEVRVWAIIARDAILAGVFRVGQELRQKYRKNPTPELMAQIKKEGDIHIINVHFFFNMWVEKTNVLRDAIKAVIFGVIYGKGASALAKDIKPQQTEDAVKQIKAMKALIAEDKGSNKELEKLREYRDELKNRDWKTYAQDLIEKLFTRFTAGRDWLDWAKNHVTQYGYVYAPTGRRRNLYGVLTGIEVIIAALGRRAMNAPIQGMASDIALTASRLVSEAMYAYILKWHPEEAISPELPAEIEKFVHDALYSEVPYKHLLPFLHILQYMATYGVAEYYEERFGIKFPIEPEIEIEMSATEDNTFKWDFSNAGLLKSINQALDDQVELDCLEDKAAAIKTILGPLKNKELMRWLNKNYPILGVTDVSLEELLRLSEE